MASQGAGWLGIALRRWRDWWRLARSGAGAVFGRRLLIIGGQNVRVGAGFGGRRHCTLAACHDGTIDIGDRGAFNANVDVNACSGGRILIGSDVLVGPNVVMRSTDDAFDEPERLIREQGHLGKTIVIEDNVWLGSNVTLVGGVRIGRGSVVAAGAVVTKDVEPMSLVGGVPARLIRRRQTGPMTPTVRVSCSTSTACSSSRSPGRARVQQRIR